MTLNTSHTPNPTASGLDSQRTTRLFSHRGVVNSAPRDELMNYVLIVDDSAVDRQLAGGLLERFDRFHVEYASDGEDALEHLADRLPVAVVTDLQMPGMDGLELVRRVGQQFPHVPIILMTAYGSEEIALEALIQGAVDYVPKSRLANDLPQAVERILAATKGSSDARLVACLQLDELCFVMENDPRLIAYMVAHVQAVACDLKITDQQDAMRFAKAVGEGIRNAMFHGNLELKPHGQPLAGSDATIERFRLERVQQPPYRDRRVHVDTVFSHDVARVTIRDDGRGFKYASLPDVKTDPSYLATGEGHGLALIHLFTDEVRFNTPGNEITMVKRRSAQEEPHRCGKFFHWQIATPGRS